MQVASTTRALKSLLNQHTFELLDDDDDHKLRLPPLGDWTMISQFDHLPWSSMAQEEEEPMFDQEGDADDTSATEDEERILSQRLSQLSTKSDYEREPSRDGKRGRRQVPITDSVAKKVRTDPDQPDEQDRLPFYLSADNPHFNRIIRQSVEAASVLPVADLQQLAFCIHKTAELPIQEELWSAYLQCGTGGWWEKEEGQPLANRRHFWPQHVKSLISSQRSTFPSEMTDDDEQRACEYVVHQRLREIPNQLARYQTQYEEKQRKATSVLVEALEHLVREQAIVPLRLKVELALAVLRCDADDYWLQCQFQAEKPTPYQTQVAKCLHETTVQLECAQGELTECRERLRYNRPPASYDGLQIALPSSIHRLSNPTLRQTLLHRREQLIQQTKTRLMAVQLAGLEGRIDQYQTRLQEQTDQMWQQHREQVTNKTMSSALTHLIDERATVAKKKLTVTREFTIDYHVRSPYGRWENIHKNKEQKLPRLGFLTSLVVDPRIGSITHPLAEEQRQLLRRGPTYVSPCQMHLAPSLSTMDDLVRKQYAPLQHQMALLFSRYNIDISRQENIKCQIKKEFKDLFSRAIPDDIRARASNERDVSRSLRATLKKNNWMLRRTADHLTGFYLGPRLYFDQKCYEYLNESDCYHVLFTVDEHNRDRVRQEVASKAHGLNSELETMHKQKRLTKEVYERLRVNVNHISLPYLYFLPELSTDHQLTVIPMVCAHHSTTSKISRYVHRLLRPVMARAMNHCVFTDEANFIRKLIQYSQVEHHLHPTTLFATVHITNAQSLVSNSSLVETFTYFLTDHLATNQLQYTSMMTNLPQHISIATLTKLTELFLRHSIFYYEEKIYGFSKGGPNSLLLSDDLLNIYLFVWQQRVFDDVRLKTELCGRHHHTLFLTWNGSESELRLFFRSLAQRYPTMQLEVSIGRRVQFFNTHVENRQARLYTRVTHPSSLAQYTLPFVVGEARVEHSRWLLAALMRAVHACSNFSDFIEERIHLEMTYLFHGYSTEFLETHLRHFFHSTNAKAIRYSMNQTVYDKLRRRIFDFAEQQRTRLTEYQALEDNERVIRLHYLHDYGTRMRFHERFHQIWASYLKEDPHLSNEKTRITLHTHHVYSLNALLAKQKPSVALLCFLPT